MKYPNQRYHDDPQFRMLVEQLFNLIINTQFTPTEIREAAMLAQVKYETLHARPITVSPDFLAELNRNSSAWDPSE